MKDSGVTQTSLLYEGSSLHLTSSGQFALTFRIVGIQSAITFSQTDLQGLIGRVLNAGAQIGKWYEHRKKPASLEQFRDTMPR